MSWTATLISASPRDDHWKIVVEFTDGAEIVQDAYRFTGQDEAALKRFVRNKASQFDRTDPVDLTAFIGQSIDVTPPGPPDPPTQDEIDKAAWFADYRELQAMLQVAEVVPALLTAQTITAIAGFRTSLENGWLNSYLGDI